MSSGLPKIAYVCPPSVGVVPPPILRYGGVERLAFWQVRGLANKGFPVIAIAPRTSGFAGTNVKTAPWDHDPILLHEVHGKATLRGPEQQAALRTDYYAHVIAALEDSDPDVILLQAPPAELVKMLPQRFLDRTVVCLHISLTQSSPVLNGPELHQWLVDHPEVRLTVLTEQHRQLCGTLASRAMVIRPGIALDEFQPSIPRSVRETQDFALQEHFSQIPDDCPGLITQIDGITPIKGQLLTLEMFRQSQLVAEGFHLVFVGDPFAGDRNHAWRSRSERYAEELWNRCDMLLELDGRVHIANSLPGSAVADLLRASTVVMAPYGLSHASVAPEWDDNYNHFEPFGLGIAQAQAAGASVLASTHVEPSMILNNRTGLRLANTGDGAAALRNLALQPPDRAFVSNWAASQFDIRGSVEAYARLSTDIALGMPTSMQPVAVGSFQR